MSSTVRTRAPRKSTLNTPVVAHVAAIRVIEDDQAQVILSNFIDQCEKLEEESLSTTLNSEGGSRTTYSGPPSEKVSHLKRLQRELRGLPPLLVESAGSRPAKAKKAFSEGISGTPANKKIKFDDDITPLNKKVIFEDEVADTSAMDVDTPVKETVDEEVKSPKKEKKEKKDKKDKKEKKDKKDKKEKKIKDKS
ncbi:unnamed protein product [Kuraishia capsulata CBS 1993]|uniref:DNA-directed RNA polymerase I subunit RPA14 n=1 Tax=Kuraishia capsulata CBS 1993 TaxID=1382522 RepID=W6MP54_9ASCO|nr:uncharacterized protein KUCA_T00004398001 [Kuraishia capsulata CBS 1993]CDK28416.1 unnamed protein product [Kuraishia capsulata CBS 1993]